MTTPSTTASNDAQATVSSVATADASAAAATRIVAVDTTTSATSDKKRALALSTDAAAANATATTASTIDDQQQRRKQRKREKHTATVAGDWDRCQFKLVRKNRFCNIQPIAGLQFCGNHVPPDAAIVSKTAQKRTARSRTRVPCPVDPRHTVYAYDLHKHVLVCNKVKDAATMQQLPYYVANINSGTHAGVATENTNDAMERVATAEGEDATADNASVDCETTAHAALSAADAQGLVDKLLAIDFRDFFQRIQTAFATHVGNIPTEKLLYGPCNQLLDAKRAAGATQTSMRHMEQQASILGHLDRLHLLDDRTAAIVELGAGRGMLSLALAQSRSIQDATMATSQRKSSNNHKSVYVLIDRAHSRGKADRFIAQAAEIGFKNAETGLTATEIRAKTITTGVTTAKTGLKTTETSSADAKEPTTLQEPVAATVVRAKIDIRHLELRRMDAIAAASSVICISKHLCGVATDLSLRAITQTMEEDKNDDVIQPTHRKVKGVALALCCHHVCLYADYVHPSFVTEIGFTPSEFALLASLTSWATCGMVDARIPTSDTTHTTVEFVLGLDKPARVALGRQCKRLVDAGRAAYLRERGFQTQLVHYCAEDDSLENCLLLAWY